MALSDKYKNKMTESSPAFSIPASPQDIVSQQVNLSIAPIQNDIYNLQLSAEAAIASDTYAEKKRAFYNARFGIAPEITAAKGDIPIQLAGGIVSSSDGTVMPSSVEDILRKFSSTQINAFIDTSRAATNVKRNESFPHIDLDGPLPEFVIPTGYTLALGQSPNSAPPARQSLLPNSRQNVLFPTIIATDAFADNPIEFVADPRLYRDTDVVELPSGSLVPYARDMAQFITVALGTPSRVYSVPTTYSILSRFNMEHHINSNFEEF